MTIFENTLDHVTSSGQRTYSLMQRLWPICRSITGDGVRETLKIIQKLLPEMVIHEVATGTKCFDWVIPKEWNIRDAYVKGPDGTKLIDFQNTNLHLVSYSVPVDEVMDLDKLQTHLHSVPDQPDVIPYVTSYYKENWGFCMAHNKRLELVPGKYQVKVDSKLDSGSLTYGELLLPGSSEKEVFLSTYICHPSMANNELSGPCLTTEIAGWISGLDRKYTYRIIFIPETIGAICYLSQHLEELKRNVIAGFVLTCVGDELTWSFMPSKTQHTYPDRVARHVMKHAGVDYKEYSFLERGSDERQYCSPGIDLPVCSVMRSKFATFPEYHTSNDNLNFVTPKGLGETGEVHKLMLKAIEDDCIPMYTVLCEPKMSDRGLRPTIGKRGSADSGKAMMNLLMYADGTKTLLEIAEIIGEPIWELRAIVNRLLEYDLLTVTDLKIFN
jgi:aminopeptidase-like protein